MYISEYFDTHSLAGIFYCKIGIYNAEFMFCQNIVSLGQLEAERMTDSVFLCSYNIYISVIVIISENYLYYTHNYRIYVM